ncbi:MAG: hypothetical protein ABIP94_03005 [Planctomycetota bacterium]
MVESDGFPIEMLEDAVAAIGAHGVLSPRNDTMRALLAAVGGDAGPCRSLSALRLFGDAEERLAAGEPVLLSVLGKYYELRRAAAARGTWLLARDVTHRERAAAALLELARGRSLAAAASAIVHDLTNLLGAGLGLASALRQSQRTATDQRILDDLQRGTQHAATLSRALVHQLEQEVPRAVVAASSVVDEAIAVIGKSAIRNGVALTVHQAPDLPSIRVVANEAVQTLREALMFLLESKSKGVSVDVAAVHMAVAGTRVRRCVRARLEATVGDAKCLAEAKRIAAFTPGLLGLLGGSTPQVAGLTAALLALRRVGGDLHIDITDDRLRVDCIWPAVHVPARA